MCKRKALWLSFTFHLHLVLFQVRPRLCGISVWRHLPFRSIHLRICGGPFKALERAGCRLGGEATPLHVSFVPRGGAGASKLPSLPALCHSGASERARGCWSAGAERECAGPQAHPSRPRPGRPRAAAAPSPSLPAMAGRHRSSAGPPLLPAAPRVSCGGRSGSRAEAVGACERVGSGG